MVIQPGPTVSQPANPPLRADLQELLDKALTYNLSTSSLEVDGEPILNTLFELLLPLLQKEFMPLGSAPPTSVPISSATIQSTITEKI